MLCLALPFTALACATFALEKVGWLLVMVDESELARGIMGSL
jgi:hypothetical protein